MAVLLSGPAGRWTLPLGTSVLGRGSGCELRIDDPRLSRRHAAFVVTGGGVAVRELGATNGVLVGGTRVIQLRELAHGDSVVCGPVQLTVAIDPGIAHPAELLGGSSGEFRPHAERDRTDAMEPIERAPGGRQMAPAIAAAVGAPQAPRRSSTCLPEPALLGEQVALVPRADHGAAKARGRRAVAAAIDLGLWVGLPALLGVVLLIAGYAWGVRTAGLAGADGAIRDILADLAGPDGVAHALARIAVLRAEFPGPFALVFLGGVGAALLMAVAAVGGLVAPTVIAGAPWGHRRQGLLLLGPGSSVVGWARASVRWAVLIATLPLAAVAWAAGRAGLHDLVAGTRLRDRQTDVPDAPTAPTSTPGPMPAGTADPRG
jgi:hypothetical protein